MIFKQLSCWGGCEEYAKKQMKIHGIYKETGRVYSESMLKNRINELFYINFGDY